MRGAPAELRSMAWESSMQSTKISKSDVTQESTETKLQQLFDIYQALITGLWSRYLSFIEEKNMEVLNFYFGKVK